MIPAASRILTGSLDRGVDPGTDSPRYRRREGIADLPICRCLAPVEPPLRRETLNDRGHGQSQPRNVVGSSGCRGRAVGQTSAVDAELKPGCPGARGPEIRATVPP